MLRSAHHFGDGLKIDLERLQEFRGHDVEADRKLQLDQRGRRQFCCDRLEGRVGRLLQLHDLVGEGERGALDLVEAGRGLPVLERLVLLVGDADILADALVRNDLVRRLAQNAGARDCKLADNRIELAGMPRASNAR